MWKKRLAAGFMTVMLMVGWMIVPPNAGEAGSAAMNSAVGKSIRVPIAMYHSILDDPKKADVYIATASQLKQDLKYLKDHGYQTVVVEDLIDYVSGQGTLPEKPVMITFDDGYYNTLYYALPILTQMDMKAVVSIVGSYTEAFSEKPDPNPAYAYLSWDEVKQLKDSGRFEVQNHSYDMHSIAGRLGSKRKAGESASAYCSLFCADVMKQQKFLEERCGVTATAFTYPYGLISPEAQDCLNQMNFSASLTCFERINYIQAGNPECLFMLGRYNRSGKLTTRAFMARLLKDAK